MRAKSHFVKMVNDNSDNLKSNYEMRVKMKKDYAADTENVSKLLEQEEAMLINRLQQTYQTQQ